MPPAINTIHILFTVIATGILFGLGVFLAQKVVAWPASVVSGAAAVICVLVLLIAWLVK